MCWQDKYDFITTPSSNKIRLDDSRVEPDQYRFWVADKKELKQSIIGVSADVYIFRKMSLLNSYDNEILLMLYILSFQLKLYCKEM